ncbi:hypothetical protein MSAN_00438600 [Mycena sanguinolenta]|uniref:F-box domain-containing protein n=1 Tax=Mycena sanguinolenta TaxID=230812 RepID=A0A8H7DLE4_9AGAR|nr:hypothetical protein MSAN_00438600 [Mycena sanguinolenta]
MSIEALRVRIVTLDSEIELQKKLLKKLEKDRSLTQRQLNAALDPVARLPLEVSSEIFLQSLPASPGGKKDVPIVLLGICNAWTDIALATPRLWTTVRVRFPCGDDFAEVLPVWFQRAGNHPLSVSISLHGRCVNWKYRVSDILWSHGRQLKHLEILDDDDFAWQSHMQDDALDLFRDATLASPSLLETLTIRCQYQQRRYFPSQILELLRSAPNIVEIIFHNVMTCLSNDTDTRILVVPTLRRLMFGETTNTDDYLLRNLSLPALEILSLPMNSLSGEGLLRFMERSTPPLRDLTLGWEVDPGHLGSVELHDCLRLSPGLTRFRMWQPDSDAVAELLTALADTPSLLPNLLDLSIHIFDDPDWEPSNFSEASWRTLVRALSTRRMERLYIVPVKTSPPIDVLVSLRDLVVAGANMHIGTEELNFVVA